jgi:hypothetical protein
MPDDNATHEIKMLINQLANEIRLNERDMKNMATTIELYKTRAEILDATSLARREIYIKVEQLEHKVANLTVKIATWSGAFAVIVFLLQKFMP